MLAELFDNEGRFKQLISVLIALATLLTAMVGWLQNDASARDDRANRVAITFALQGMGQQISGNIQAGYDYNNAFQTWNILQTSAIGAEVADNIVLANRYRHVAGRIAKLSPLLAPPYLDPETNNVHLSKYESEVYLVKVTSLQEQFRNWFEVKQIWDAKANTYILHLTILAVSLFLFGLSTTLAGTMRRIFVGMGLVIIFVTAGWVIKTYMQEVPQLPDTAIEAYARGYGLSYQEDYEAALAEYDKAISEAPDYANAYFERAFAHLNLLDIAKAIPDLEMAQQKGRDDSNVAWNLGWAYYQIGQLDKATAALQHGVALDKSEFGLQFNLILALLANGQHDQAQATLNKTLATILAQVKDAKAAQQHPPATIWNAFEEGIADFTALAERLGDKEPTWSVAPPKESLKEPTQLKELTQRMLVTLKEAYLALEYTNELPTGKLTAEIQPFVFGTVTLNDAGEVITATEAQTFPPETKTIGVAIEYDGMQDGQHVVYKVYNNGEEDLSWRELATWSEGASGETELVMDYAYSNVFSLTPGEYLLEMYVDNHLAQSGSFMVE